MGTAFLYGNSGSGGKGAELTVTAPAGSTVTVSKDGKSKTKAAGSDGIVVFKGLQSGTWNLTITEGEQEASKTVEIVADYATSITFFTATINVTYPAGSTCTATCGSTTLTAPDTSGTWACVVPNTGTWTITATDGANTKSEAVSIATDGQSVSLTLSYRYYLYNYLNGQTAYDGITGGWNHYETVDGCVSIVHTSLNQEAFTICASKIDFSGYTTLYIESYRYDNTSSESGVHYAIGTQTDTSIFTWGAIRGSFGGSRKAWSTWSIDVSSLTESAYFAFWGYYEKAAIRAMWLE